MVDQLGELLGQETSLFNAAVVGSHCYPGWVAGWLRAMNVCFH
jgi:hypothetical protein